ncbi:hypothetical protein EWB00_000816 [Schistosoma japonicum]|uniref:Uncharacterized protein n=1 Tax=Schistosoma japonicum TaxID=6182 RepID=A0A4Z2DI07_SCHJA|nr:hypothetical protein EWB00_000816 [Schistosoma japonicum]
MGPLLIAYKECPVEDALSSSGWSCAVGSVIGYEKAIGIGVILRPKTIHPLHKPQVIFDRRGDCNIVRVRHAVTRSLFFLLWRSTFTIHSIVCGRREQISNGLEYVDGFSQLTLDKLSNAQIASSSLLALLKTCCINSVKDALAKMPKWHLMEPMMEIELQLPAKKGDSQ